MGFVILWVLQDFLTVLLGGRMQVPELFLLGIVFRLVTTEKDGGDRLWAIWSAFAGGLMWDLRWVGIPGFFTLGYVVVVLIVLWVWSAVPTHGQTVLVAMALMEASQIIPPLLPVLALGGSTGWGFFLAQQAYSMPALLLCLYLYVRRDGQSRSSNA